MFFEVITLLIYIYLAALRHGPSFANWKISAATDGKYGCSGSQDFRRSLAGFTED
jgi:hypothetical protein